MTNKYLQGMVRACLLLVMPILACALYGQPQFTPQTRDAILDPWRWRELDLLGGLSIRCMDQSPDGILWIGTDHGLVSYDGYELTRFTLEPDVSVIAVTVVEEDEVHFRTEASWGRLLNGEFETLLELEKPSPNSDGLAFDQFGGVYLGVREGLFYYRDRQVKSVDTVFSGIDSVVATAGNRIWIAEEGTGRIAVYRGLSDGSLGSKPLFQSDALLESPRLSFHLFLDSKENVWMVSRLPNVPTRYYTPDFSEHEQDDFRKLGGNNVIWDIAEGHDGVMWLVAARALHRFAVGRWDVIDNWNYEVPSTRSVLLTLNDGSLLIAGRREKVFVVDRSATRFSGYEGMHFQCRSADGSRWFLTKGGLVGRQARDATDWQWFSSTEGIPDTPNLVSSSSDGSVWVSGSHRGVASVARFDGFDWKRDMYPKMGFVLSHLSGYETSSGDILFGMNSAETEGNPGQSSGGLVRYVRKLGGFEAVSESPPHVPFRVPSISEDESGALFIAGANLNRVGKQGLQPVPVPSLEFPGWWVDHIAKDGAGDQWVSLWGLGAYRYREGQWDVFTEDDGLPSNQVSFALPSSKWGGVWVATSGGISRFDYQSWTDALPSSIVVSREGVTLVEGTDGALWVNIASRSWYFRSEVGTVVEGTFHSIKYTPERDVPSVSLKTTPQASNFGGDLYFEWEGHDFWSVTPDDALEYSYRVGGVDWSPFARRRSAVVSIEQAGEHDFEVRVRDRDWNIRETPASFHFVIVAPLWQRPWFIVVTLGAVVVIALLITLLIRNRIRHVLEVEELKIQFFTYLSHELRTPLSVVLGPIESAMKRIEDSVALEKLRMAKKNAHRVLTLVDQLLDFRKFEYTQKGYEPHLSDLNVFLGDCVDSLRPLSEEKVQRLVYEANFDPGLYSFDPDMLQKISNNLLANAIKYSPDGSCVEVTAKIEKEAELDGAKCLIFSVTDEGPGIDREAQRMVFEPFYRVTRDGSRAKGAGLGLALVKDLVDAWGGSVEIQSPVSSESEEAAGTRFRVVLPLEPANSVEQMEVLSKELDGASPAGTGEEARDLVLLVDDDADFRAFVEAELRDRFEILTAKDGEEGLALARERMPGVIVSDFHMPGMDGGVLSRSLKEDLETCHIPIILLTSDLSSETELASIENHADEFLRKPVPMELLVARLVATLEMRRRLRDLFSRQVKVDPKQIAVTSSDEEFLGKAIALVEANMQDDAFDVEQFSKEMAMSSRTLYRKLKAVTGMTPVQFVRSIRLKRAAQLFEGGVTSVSEAMVQVGILDASYFSRAFKKEFGKSPSQYIAER